MISWPSLAGTAKIRLLDKSRLDPETIQLLWTLVEAARAVPRSQRGDFMALRHLGGNILQHPGLQGGAIQNFDEGDLRDLREAGFLRITNSSSHDEMFELRREAFDFYDQDHRDSAEPIAAQQRLVVERVSSNSFTARYRHAFSKWRDAESLLWEDDSVKNLTTIGHLCREAMQLFVTRLIELHTVADADPDPSKTINRLRSVIDARRPHLSSRKVELVDAVAAYWSAVNGVVQRQEHGEQKGGEELTWEDGRSVLFHTAAVMEECDRILS